MSVVLADQFERTPPSGEHVRSTHRASQRIDARMSSSSRGRVINHVANDDEECSAPVELAEIQNRLFL
jgi:hypothetical protein